jgi:hypothetical protein
MNPPNPFTRRKSNGYSNCFACRGWFQDCQIFFAEGIHWVLCRTDFVDYWENTDVLPVDYKWYNVGV